MLGSNCLPHPSKPSALTRECTLLALPLMQALSSCCCYCRAACRCLASLGSSHGAVNTAGGCSACMLPACVPGLNEGTARQVCLAAQRPCGHGLAGASGAMAWGDWQQHSVHCSRSRIMAGGSDTHMVLMLLIPLHSAGKAPDSPLLARFLQQAGQQGTSSDWLQSWRSDSAHGHPVGTSLQLLWPGATL